MDTLIQLSLSGLALGSLYSLVALGYVLIYRSTQVLSFAHGELLSMGAFLMISYVNLGLSWPLAFLAAVSSAGLLAMLMERVVLRPLLGQPIFITIIMTLFLGLVLRIILVQFYGVEPLGMDTPWEPSAAISIGKAKILYSQIGMMVAGIVFLGLFYLLENYSKLGISLRAASYDQEACLSLGIPVGKLFGFTWFMAAMLAAVGGIFLGMFPNTVSPDLGYIAFRVFPVVIVGGLISPLGAVVASLLIAFLEVFSQSYLNPALGEFGRNFHAVVPYIFMILFLLIRPYGLFGKKEVERV
jgi:branched-chain amino acid transport system permease protein